jgi:hypothetical protein
MFWLLIALVKLLDYIDVSFSCAAGGLDRTCPSNAGAAGYPLLALLRG